MAISIAMPFRPSLNALLMPTSFIASALWTLWLMLYLGWPVLQRMGVGVSIRTTPAVVCLGCAFLPVWVLGAVCAVAVSALAFIAPERTAASA